MLVHPGHTHHQRRVGRVDPEPAGVDRRLAGRIHRSSRPDALTGQTVVQQAGSYANEGHSQHIVVVGHTDTSGSTAYNARLSERRAKAVADGLVAMGVPSTALAVDWHGETDPAVNTGDGVKEPLNRRTTVAVEF